MQEFSEWLLAFEYELPLELQVKAKECLVLEKEQIKKAYNEGDIQLVDAEQYYNETYKQQKKGNKCFECNNDKGNNELYCSFCRNQN